MKINKIIKVTILLLILAFSLSNIVFATSLNSSETTTTTNTTTE